MKTTMSKLLLLNRTVGKYLLMKLPAEEGIKRYQKIPSLPIVQNPLDWFREASHIVLNPNSFELGFVEEVFSRFLRTLG